MICYAIIDTNVIVSALLSKYEDAATVQLIGRVLTGEIVPVYSREIIKEYREVLGRKKFRFDPDMIRYIILTIERYGILVEPSATGMILSHL